MPSTATVTKPKVPAKSAVELIHDADQQISHGEPETISLADITGEGTMLELDPEALVTETKAKPAKKSEKADETDDMEDDATEDDEEAPTGKTEEDDDDTTEEDEENAGALAVARKIVEQFSDDPASAIKALWDAAPSDAQSRFIKALSAESGKGKTESAEVDFEPESDFERGLLPAYNQLKTIPQFKEDVQSAFGQHAEFINDSHLRLEVAEAMLQSIGTAVGVKFPEADFAAMMKAVRSGKSYQDATKAFKAEITKAANRLKQGVKPRPAGTSSTAGDRVVFDGNDDLATMIKKYQARM